MNMRKFLIQKKVSLDFIFLLERSIEYLKWREEKVEVLYRTIDELPIDDPSYVPVGTIEFVHKQLGKEIPPLNVPIQLWSYDKDYPILSSPPTSPCFIKNNDKIKAEENGYYKDNPPIGNYQYREDILNIDSEWRVFICADEVVGCQPYLGNPLSFPDKRQILEMVSLLRPLELPAYTLDVYVREGGFTGPMEVHRFYSCGTYGFSYYQKYILMLIRTWKSLLML